MPAASPLMGTLLVRHRATSARSVEMSLDTAGTSAQCHLNKPPNWNSESSWGGPLVRAGPPDPLFARRIKRLRHCERPTWASAAVQGDRPTIYAGDAVAPYLFKRHWARVPATRPYALPTHWISSTESVLRSEERRVGKECRSRWS